jgi:LmbE family N-acetylglucosaminyl deacetylase
MNPTGQRYNLVMMRVRRRQLPWLAALLLGVAVFPRVAEMWPTLRGYYRNLPTASRGAPLWAPWAGTGPHPYPEWPLPPHGTRILIVAPHGDDEALGCAGLIQVALQRGAQVRVALMTNGDGFHLAAARASGKPCTGGSLPPVSPAEYLQLARQRQAETLRALALLGLPESDVDFLGYPDRGLLPLWQAFWDPARPYTSPYTRTDHSPYDRTFRRHAPYCGQAVMDDLCALLRRFRPQSVFAPHPDDSHPDHKATYAFVTTALARLGETGRVAVGGYLVHAPSWPSPPGLFPPLPLTPPTTLARAGHRWQVLPLSRSMRKRKREALLAYTSQTAVLGRLLESFVRANELFERDPPSPFSAGPRARARPTLSNDSLGVTWR